MQALGDSIMRTNSIVGVVLFGLLMIIRSTNQLLRNLQRYANYLDLNDGYTHIAVYARKHTERRCVELALEALRELSKLTDKFVVHFFGDDNFAGDFPFLSVNYGI